MQFLKLLADVVNFDHWGIAAQRTELFALIDAAKEFIEEQTLSEIESVQFMDSVCVIRKKLKSHIGLGPRIGSGTEALVVGAIRDILGQTSTPPIQDLNPFSRPSDLSVGWLESVNRQNQELTKQKQELTAQRDELAAQRDGLIAQVAVHEASIEAIRNTLSWRITKPLRYLRSFGRKDR
jgi:hypothetical protein